MSHDDDSIFHNDNDNDNDRDSDSDSFTLTIEDGGILAALVILVLGLVAGSFMFVLQNSKRRW